MDNDILRRHGILNENQSTRHGIDPYKLLVRKAPEVSKTAPALTIALGHPPELHGKTLLLKTSSHTG